MIKMSEYKKRRKILMQEIGPGGILILPSAAEVVRNGDAHYYFRQQSDFYYLTGFAEPDAVLVLAPKRKEGEYILFNRERNQEKEMWEGPRAGQIGACRDFLADQSFPISQLKSMLPTLLADREVIHYSLGHQLGFDKILINALNDVRSKIRGGVQAPMALVDILPSIHEMRLFKSKDEIATIQQAVDITEKAHVRAMQVCKPGMFEYQLEAELMYEFYRQGARYPAYPSIVGAGSNTCVLHYIENQKMIAKHDLVLIDAGAEYQNYAADITRTFPASGKFSAEQRAIYELVLAAQLAAIKSIKPGASWTLAQDIIVQVITEGLVDLGILRGNVDGLIERNAYYPFYMHRSGHWLGLDVHDVGRYKVDKHWRCLSAGQVITVEPGIYISTGMPGVHKRWCNIGVRIEDDVLVSEKGHQVLSARIPKSIADIEALMNAV